MNIGKDDKPYITYKVGADTVTKKLGSLDPDNARFIYYKTPQGGSNTYYLPDGIYIYFTMNGGGGGTTVNGSIWASGFAGATSFQYGRYGIADTSKSNVVKQAVSSSDHNALAVFYKISD